LLKVFGLFKSGLEVLANKPHELQAPLFLLLITLQDRLHLQNEKPRLLFDVDSLKDLKNVYDVFLLHFERDNQVLYNAQKELELFVRV
jgi:hypothetical protein